MSPRHQLNRVLNITVVALAILLVAAYGADALIVRYRVNPLVTLHIPRYLAVPLKGGRTEFIDDGTDNQVCVRAIFPQLGHYPCWYASRTTEERVDE